MAKSHESDLEAPLHKEFLRDQLFRRQKTVLLTIVIGVVLGIWAIPMVFEAVDPNTDSRLTTKSITPGLPIV